MRDFLNAIWGPYDGWGEIRCLKGKEVKQAFLRTVEHLPGSELLMCDETGWDVYYGVLPRIHPSGTAANCPSETTVLWADVDAKSHPSKAHALYTVNQFPVSPSAIVDSGGGYHVYWLLRQPLDLPTAQRIMKRVAGVIHGDHVQDAPRILRLPGTHNHKYATPAPVRLLRLDSTYRHDPTDFAAWGGEDRPARAFAATGQSKGDLPQSLVAAIEQQVQKGAQSERDFGVACGLVREGYGFDDIWRVFVDHPEGCGSKLYELGGPSHRAAEHYLTHTILRAEEQAWTT